MTEMNQVNLKSDNIFSDNSIKKCEDKVIYEEPIKKDNSTISIEKKNKKPMLLMNKVYSEKQTEVATNTLIYGFNCTGVTLGALSLIVVPNIKGLTVNQTIFLEVLGASLLSFCLVKCVKGLIKIGCPLNGKPPLIEDDDVIEETKEEDQSKRLIIKK